MSYCCKEDKKENNHKETKLQRSYKHPAKIEHRVVVLQTQVNY